MIKGLIVAAGESKRMGEVKQLLKINGYPLVVWAVMNLRHAGIEEICVVTGKEADTMEQILEPWGVKVIPNEAYATTDMFTSIKLGLKQFKEASAVFVLPVDQPMIKVDTLMTLKEAYEKHQAKIIYPTVQGVKGHPPLIDAHLFQRIIESENNDGLRAVLANLEEEVLLVDVEDKGCILDADTKEEFEQLEKYGKSNFGISLSFCDDLASELGFFEEDRDAALMKAVEAMEWGKKNIAEGSGCDLVMEMNLAYFHYLAQGDNKVENEWIRLLEEKGYRKLSKRMHG